jgi:transcriptional regulator with XRE-family HTH domain
MISVNTQAAIRQLRKALDLTQQDLANRLGITARAIANYEKGRLPHAKILADMSILADAKNLPDLAQQFRNGLAHNLDSNTNAKPNTHAEQALARLFLCAARNKDKIPEWEELQRLLVSSIENLIKRSATEFTLTDPSDLTQALDQANIFIMPSAAARVETLAKQRSMMTGDSHEKATTEVLLANPDLYEELVKERQSAAGPTKKGSSKK